MVLLAWTKACPEAFLPHLEAMATQVGELWQAGRIRAGKPSELGFLLLFLAAVLSRCCQSVSACMAALLCINAVHVCG